MLRKEIPDIALRTTLISGFPGETNENHEECVDFVANMKFERLGVFPYSPEEGTPAAGYDRQLPDEIKQEWADEIMQTEQDVIFAQNEEMIGRKLSVIVDGYLPEDAAMSQPALRDTWLLPYEIAAGSYRAALIPSGTFCGEVLGEDSLLVRSWIVDSSYRGMFLADGERYVSGPQRMDLERSALRILKLMLDITK